MSTLLKLGLPAGSLQEATADLFRKAGYEITFASRSYYPAIDDQEIHCTLIRAQEMPRYVENGSLDCGLTGLDWIRENDAQVVELAELVYSKPPPGEMGALRSERFPRSGAEGPGREADRDRTGRVHQAVAGGPWSDRQGRVQLGGDRGQAASSGGRHRRSH